MRAAFQQVQNLPFGMRLFSRDIGNEIDAMQKVLKERGIDTMLEEARESNQETDAEHLKRS